jgi:uncharacterized membrane protein YcaP (DUF421 family)
METVVRVVILYIFIMAGLRVVGKREFSQLSPLELVTLLIIPEIVSQALTREDSSMTNALVGTATLIVLVYLSSLLQYNNSPIDKAINGLPAVVVRHGEYVGKHMNEERITPEEIFNAMHQSGLDRLEQVRWAILETDGKISIVPEEQGKNVISPSAKKEGALA